jgi:hypothetical protein
LQRYVAEAHHRQAGEYPHDPQVVVSVGQQCCCQSLLAGYFQLQSIQVDLYSHEVEENDNRSQHFEADCVLGAEQPALYVV